MICNTNKKKNLTIKQRKWIDSYIKLGNATEAAMQTYDCKDRESAAQIGYENMRKLDYGELMEEGGITDEILLKKVAEGLDATKKVNAVYTVKNSTVQSIQYIDYPDYAVRLKYLETAFKLKKRLTNRIDLSSSDKPLPIPIYSGLSVKASK